MLVLFFFKSTGTRIGIQVSHKHWVIFLFSFQIIIAMAVSGETDCQSPGYSIFQADETCGFNYNLSIKIKSVPFFENLSTTFLSATMTEWVKQKNSCLFWEERNPFLPSLDKLQNNSLVINMKAYLISKMWSHTDTSTKIIFIPACCWICLHFTTHFPLQQACISLLLLKNCRSSLHLTSILYYCNAAIKDYPWDH